MKDYLTIANDKIFYITTIILIGFVFIQSGIFLRMALKRAKELNIDKSKINSAFRAAAGVSIVPSIAIVVAFITLAPVLGIPIAWARLSIVGSMLYEITAASIGATSMGVNGLGAAGYTPQVFANSVWAMTFGTTWTIIICVFLMRKVKSKYNEKTTKDSKWNAILTNAVLLGVFGSYITDPLVKGGMELTTLIFSASIMGILTAMIVKFKANWLREFALPLSMIGAMIGSVLITL